MNIVAVKQQLSDQAERVAMDLLPLGKRDGKNWRNGSTDPGDPGQSLAVFIDGNSAGQWKDFATDEAGDLLDLIRCIRGISLQDALEYAVTEYRLDVDKPAVKKIPRAEKPKTPARIPERSNSGRGREFLQTRGFTDIDSLFELYKLREIEAEGATNGEVDLCLPYIHREGVLSSKRRTINHSLYGNNKTKFVAAGNQMCLFGWQTIDDNDREVVICEGEFDQMVLSQECGIPALSIPTGAAGGTWWDFEYENLERFETIFICYDPDSAGQKGAKQLAANIGARARIMKLQDGDPNDLLKKHGSAGCRKLVRDALEEARWGSTDKIKNVSEFYEEVLARFDPNAEEEEGFSTHWSKATGKIFFRRSELIVLNGVNGHGKSQLAMQLMADAGLAGEKVCVASMEMREDRLLERLIKQCGATGNPTNDYIEKVFDWISGWMYLYVDIAARGKTKEQILLDSLDYAWRRYGCTTFLIDSLQLCGNFEENMNAQQAFMSKLVEFKLERNVTIFLITHAKKGPDEYQMGGKWDIKGSSGISDLADQVYTVFRNKRKEEHLDLVEKGFDDPNQKIIDMADSYLICHKNRHGDWEGKMGFFFNPKTFRYESSDRTARSYLEMDCD